MKRIKEKEMRDIEIKKMKETRKLRMKLKNRFLGKEFNNSLEGLKQYKKKLRLVNDSIDGELI